MNNRLDSIILSLGIEENGLMHDVFNYAFDMLPYAGKVMQTVKINRLKKRLKDNDDRLKSVEKILADSDNLPFYKEYVFPIVLEDILEDHENKKIKYILTGFYNVIKYNSTSEEEILSLFDTLRDLRAHEILLLISRARNSVDGMENSFNEVSIKLNSPTLAEYANHKFERMGLASNFVSVQGRGFFTYYGIGFMKFLRDYDFK